MRIQKGVPIPVRKQYNPRTPITRLAAQMVVDDCADCDNETEMCAVRIVIKRYLKGRAKVEKCATGSGWRVWRIA